MTPKPTFVHKGVIMLCRDAETEELMRGLFGESLKIVLNDFPDIWDECDNIVKENTWLMELPKTELPKHVNRKWLSKGNKEAFESRIEDA